jgi:hypothetical protein
MSLLLVPNAALAQTEQELIEEAQSFLQRENQISFSIPGGECVRDALNGWNDGKDPVLEINRILTARELDLPDSADWEMIEEVQASKAHQTRLEKYNLPADTSREAAFAYDTKQLFEQSETERERLDLPPTASDAEVQQAHREQWDREEQERLAAEAAFEAKYGVPYTWEAEYASENGLPLTSTADDVNEHFCRAQVKEYAKRLGVPHATLLSEVLEGLK